MHTDSLKNTTSHIALVGAPNSGKTTLYNWITGSNQKTVNYAG
ncbi:MAG: 50S ribosome-binding GTPase, partial [Bdellovibrionales bacterium]|nr:50S ribosome-binding GTPase [Bdellovibrionales bacterium]